MMVQKKEIFKSKKMTTPIRKETLIVRLWTNDGPIAENDWRGTAEFIGKGQSSQFQTLDEFVDWMRQELEI